MHVLILVHCTPSELLYLNSIFCYKLIQIGEVSVSEVDIWPGVHICLLFATAKCWHFGNTVLNPAIDSTFLSTGTALGWVEAKVKDKLWCLRRPSKISFDPGKSTFLSEGTVMNWQAENRWVLMLSLLKWQIFKKSLSFNTLETIRDNTSFPKQSLSALQARTSSSGWWPEFIPGYCFYPMMYLPTLRVCILLQFIIYSSSVLPFCLITEQIPSALAYIDNEWIMLITF